MVADHRDRTPFMSDHRSAFVNREEAGQLLAEELVRDRSLRDPLVLALPRGGLPVAFEVARVLEASLDLLLVRKLGVPGHEELAMGAISSGGVQVLNDELIAQLRLSPDVIEQVVRAESAELARRETLYRANRPAPVVEGRTVIVVDDGIATGSTMQAAITLLRKQKAGRIVVAVPTAPPDTVRALEKIADDIVVLMTPEPFRSVGQWYRDFTQVGDLEVRHFLETDEMDSNR